MVLAYLESSPYFFIVMNAKLMRAVQQGETFAVLSQKSENGQLTISFIDSRLLELVFNY